MSLSVYGGLAHSELNLNERTSWVVLMASGVSVQLGGVRRRRWVGGSVEKQGDRTGYM